MTDEDREAAWRHGDGGGLPLYQVFRDRDEAQGEREGSPEWWWWAISASLVVAGALGAWLTRGTGQ